jgi:chaperone BCS1
LEDINVISSNRDAKTKSSRQIVIGSPSKQSKPTSGKVFLSALLNVIDGVESQEGWILIITTNHITRLDEALIQPGRMNKKVKLGLVDNQMAADLFCLVFKPIEGDVAFTEDA